MYFDDIIDSIAYDAFTPLFSARKSVRSAFDGRVSSDEHTLTLSIDVPGVKKEDVDITFEASTTRIAAKRADTGTSTTWRYTLAKEWDINSAEAGLEDGVLTLRFTRREQDKPRKLLVK